jgi:hypothetical protein
MARILNLVRRIAASRLLRPSRSGVFFVLFYLYFVFEIDVRLLYHCCGLIDNFPAFYTGGDFFGGFLGYPGGLLEYLSAFLSQLFYYSWAGAAVVTVQAWLMCLGADHVVAALGMPRWRGLRFVGPLLVLVAYSRYTFYLPTAMGFLTALLAFCLYLRLRSDKIGQSLVLLLVVSAALYVTAGGPFLLLALLVGLYELLFRRRVPMALASLAVGVVMPYVLGVVAYGQRPHDAYFGLLPLSWKVMGAQTNAVVQWTLYGLYLFLPAAVAALGLGHLWSGRATARTGRTGPGDGASVPQKPRWTFWGDNQGAFGLNCATLVLAAMTLAVLIQFRDTKVRTLFQVDYYCRQKMWSKVIEAGRRVPYHYLVCHAVNRALYHTGRLGDDMFAFPQHPSALLLTGREALWQKFDTCIDLGLLNEAENALTISMEMFGERPVLLQRLALVNMAKGNIGAARVLFGALSKAPFWADVARNGLARLDSDPTLTNDPEVQRLRAVMLRTDFVSGGGDSLASLLHENPRNRMAYEYALAALLLVKDVDAFMKAFDMFHLTGESKFPRHHQEALLLFRTLKQQPIDVPGQFIATTVKTQLHEFLQALQRHSKDPAAARAALKPLYGDTYFYYYFFFGSQGG